MNLENMEKLIEILDNGGFHEETGVLEVFESIRRTAGGGSTQASLPSTAAKRCVEEREEASLRPTNLQSTRYLAEGSTGCGQTHPEGTRMKTGCGQTHPEKSQMNKQNLQKN